MPRIGKVAGINNAKDVFDAQRLFNKLKGRLTEIQKQVAFLEGRIEFVESQKRVQADYNAITGAEVATGGAFGSGSGGSSSGGGGGGEETIPIGSDEVSASSSIVNRKYVSNSGYQVNITWSEYTNDALFHQKGNGEDIDEIWLTVSRADYQYGLTITGNGINASFNAYSRTNTEIWDYPLNQGASYTIGKYSSDSYAGPSVNNGSSGEIGYDGNIPPPPAGFIVLPPPAVGTSAVLAQAIGGLGPWKGTNAYSAQQLEAIPILEDITWELQSEGVSGELFLGEFLGSVGFVTDIKIRYSLSMGSNVLSAELTNYWGDDVGGIHNHAETFYEDDPRSRTTDWIIAGTFDSKGQPTNGELGLEITDITLKG